MATNRFIFVFTFLIFLATAFFIQNSLAEMSSENYVSPLVVSRSGGSESNSTNYLMNTIVAEISGVGVSENYSAQVGFFYSSFAPSGPGDYPLIFVEPVLANSSSLHAFTVTAGTNNHFGNSMVLVTSAQSSVGSCSVLSNTTSGVYYNATFRCIGPAYQSTQVNITFCAAENKCNTTSTVSNIYPNHIPSIPVLNIPFDGNTTVHELRPYFNWTPSIDSDGDDINYTFNLTTQVNCQPLTLKIISDDNFTPAQDLCPDSLKTYNWSVRACDNWNCSDWSSEFDFILEPFVDINMIQSTVDFGTLDIFQSKNTTTGSPLPFELKNDGNVYADMVNITMDVLNPLWDSVLLDTSYFQVKARQPPGNFSAFDVPTSITSWENVTLNVSSVVTLFNHSEGNDSVYVDVSVEVPGAEIPGVKSTLLYFVWEETPYRTN